MADTFPCEQCGADLTFAVGTRHLACEYCGQEQDIPETQATVNEHDFSAGLAGALSETSASLLEGGNEVQCDNCGAHAIMSGQADTCAFCGSAVVLVADQQRLIRPESLLPFAITRKQAQASFKKWVRSRWFAPNDLSKRAQGRGMDGVYLPYWTYDSQSTTTYRGRRGEYYYVTESYTDSEGNRRTRQVRKTRWYPAAGTVHNHFDDVLIPASTTLPEKLYHKLEPWDLGALQPFEPSFLAGFVAEVYRVPLDQGFDKAQVRMEPEIRSTIKRDIGGDTQQISSMNVNHDNVTFKHCLLPLWISSFRYGEKVFRFMVNARTGEVAGERPWSAIKITLAVMFGLMVLAIVLYVGSQR